MSLISSKPKNHHHWRASRRPTRSPSQVHRTSIHGRRNFYGHAAVTGQFLQRAFKKSDKRCKPAAAPRPLLVLRPSLHDGLAAQCRLPPLLPLPPPFTSPAILPLPFSPILAPSTYHAQSSHNPTCNTAKHIQNNNCHDLMLRSRWQPSATLRFASVWSKSKSLTSMTVMHLEGCAFVIAAAIARSNANTRCVGLWLT